MRQMQQSVDLDLERRSSLTETLDRMHFARMMSTYGAAEIWFWWNQDIKNLSDDPFAQRTDPRR